ncbi:hypothetical protein DQ384_23870 [Sphaerisporangium album]|uniref:DUF4386 family protein n=1 Tax=Sphaerisporangium album TaxID=509200 RepID=A0A367FE43_9ACTN|nr:hypothetical protein [Sphaerisporangium album]RCG28189.1 hypothetical protein DQ384_23870 [Sphaerisporangium album]
MLRPSRSIAFRRYATGAGLILSGVFQLTATLADPGTWGDEREVVSFGDNPAMAQLQSALYHWSWVLLPLAAIGLLHFLRTRAVVLGHIAGTMTALGFVSLSALLLGDPVQWYFGQRYPPDQAEKMFDAVYDLPGVVFSFQLPWVFLGPLGLVLLLVALWRAGFAHWWAPVAGLITWGSTYVTEYGPSSLVWSGGNLLVLGYLGVKVLRLGDEGWASYYPAAAPGRTTPDSYANTTA